MAIRYNFSKSKYNNKKIVYEGITFDSKFECERYKELILLEKAGKISDLRLQHVFEIVPKQPGERCVNYVADFVYFDKERNICIIEDTKGFKTPDYVIKRKLVKLQYCEPGVCEFREVQLERRKEKRLALKGRLLKK